MPYKYVCKNCLAIFKAEEEIFKGKTCPKCRAGNLTTDGMKKKISPKRATDLDKALTWKPPRVDEAEKTRKAKREQDIRQRRLANYLVDEGLDESSSDEFEDEDDDAWAPPPNYNIGMRLTTGLRCACRAVYPHDVTYRKTASNRIGPSPGRGNQNTVMGRSAWAHVGGPDYAVNPKVSFEWCHLIADSLGGPTVAANLVAASYGCNTEMNVIEHRIQGRTELSVEVIAHCNAEHNAEMIIYTVRYPLHMPIFTRNIDAKNENFTQQDMDDLIGELNTWFRAVGLPQKKQG